MRRIGRPTNLPQNQQVRSAFAEFCTRHRLKFVPGLDRHVDLEETDPRLDALLDLLSQHGFSPKPPSTKEMTDEDWLHHVLHERYRVYDESDLEQCEYLLFRPLQETLHGQFDRHEGLMRVIAKRPPGWMRRAAFARDFSADLASDRARQVIETADLRGPRFSPVQYVPGYNAKDDNPIWWEIETDIHLPPADTMEFMNLQYVPVEPGDVSRGWVTPRRMPGELPPEWRYRRSVIESVGPFDFAAMFEPRGHERPGLIKARGTFVVSQRFYRVCREHNLEASWSPVRVDED